MIKNNDKKEIWSCDSTLYEDNMTISVALACKHAILAYWRRLSAWVSSMDADNGRFNHRRQHGD